MTFAIRLTHPDERFRKRLARQICEMIYPCAMESTGDSWYRITVDPHREEQVRGALEEIAIWGAEITESN